MLLTWFERVFYTILLWPFEQSEQLELELVTVNSEMSGD